jgi:hypothetical protein
MKVLDRQVYLFLRNGIYQAQFVDPLVKKRLRPFDR